MLSVRDTPRPMRASGVFWTLNRGDGPGVRREARRAAGQPAGRKNSRASGAISIPDAVAAVTQRSSAISASGTGS